MNSGTHFGHGQVNEYQKPFANNGVFHCVLEYIFGTNTPNVFASILPCQRLTSFCTVYPNASLLWSTIGVPPSKPYPKTCWKYLVF